MRSLALFIGLLALSLGASAQTASQAAPASAVKAKTPQATKAAVPDAVKEGQASNKPTLVSESKPNLAGVKGPPKPKKPEAEQKATAK